MSLNNDPLINASLNNIITPNNFRITDYSYYKLDSSSNPITTTQSELYNNFINSLKSSSTAPTPILSSLLDQTTIRRACCKGDASGSFFKIKVKIPYDATYVNTLTISQDMKNFYQTYKYAEKDVLVPSSLCGIYNEQRAYLSIGHWLILLTLFAFHFYSNTRHTWISSVSQGPGNSV